jgi:hypothetical protein
MQIDLLATAVRATAGIVVCILGLVFSVSAQVCSHPNDFSFYSHGDYVVKRVRITSPLDFLPFVSQRFDQIKQQLPVQPDKVFSASAVSEGRALIDTEMKAGESNVDPRSRILFIIARIENCHETAPLQLDVVYRVFTSNYNSYFSHSWETKSDEIQRPATATATAEAATTTKGSFLVAPFIDYNRTKQLSGGARLAMRMPGGIFDTMQFAASGSPTSNSEEMDLVGSRAPQHTALNHLEYRLAYTHSDTPSGDNRLREGTLSAQFFGATKPLGTSHVVVRFGASVEGGNRQTQGNPTTLNEESVESSGYGSLKAYLGATLRTHSYSFAGSYGLQAGTLGATGAVDFVKHIADAALTARWFMKDDKPGEFHKSLTLETQFTGGVIQTLGLLPVAERFFGGNDIATFIPGDSWRIRSGPVIRSIPQNRLNAASTVGPIGGTSFYSANFTISRPVWGRPIIPKELAGDPQFVPALRAARASAREALITAYKNKLTKVYDPLIAHLAPVERDLATLNTLLDNLPSNAGTDVQDAASDVHDSMVMANQALQDKETLPSKLDSLLKEPNSATCQDDENCSIITELRFDLGALIDALNAAHADAASQQAKTIQDSLAAQQPQLVTELNGLDFSEATKLADADLQEVEPVLNSFLNEINIISISPVGIFDVARIWPDKFGTRFGIGGGVRLSLVNFNVTLGYAVNPHPRFQEGRGALVFSMDVTDLFR